MDRNTRVVPLHRLPTGYAHGIDTEVRTPVRPRPAATLALLRKTGKVMEVLLLKRGNQTRFIPGAFVFPGGRVDAQDGYEGPGSFAMTALRETFEETGILLAEGGTACYSVPLDGTEEGSRLRRALHGGEIIFQEVLSDLGMKVDLRVLTSIGHWVTPVQERYRYDTRFFGVEVSESCRAFPDGTELVEARWLTPQAALRLNQEGLLPMVFPTILTLEALSAHSAPQTALGALRERNKARLLPKVEMSDDGIRMTVEESEQDPSARPQS